MDETEKKPRAGIKNFKFTSSGTNGKSHRANYSKKKRNHLANVRARAELYSTFQGEKGWKAGSPDCLEWHSRIKAISNGNA